MEVRCGGCNKLFRVPDEKIVGKGIKFACTRCGESVKITKEEFEHHALSQTAASALDMFVPKPKPVKAEATPERKNSTAVGAPGPTIEAPPKAPSPPEEPSVEDVFNSPAFTSMLRPSEPQPEETDLEPSPSEEPSVEDVFNSPAFTSMLRPSEPQPEAAKPLSPGLETKSVRKPEAAPAVSTSQPVKPVSAIAAPPSSPKKEPVKPAQPAVDIASKVSPAPSPSGRRLLVPIILLVVVGLAAAGALYLKGGAQKSSEKATATALKSPELIAPVGLQVSLASGAMDPSGDLIISGSVENEVDKENPAWHAVAEVYDAQGTVLIQARILNGLQLYTQRDYDILARRGVNIQELKIKSREPGVKVPANGAVNFEIHILEPPAGIASFNVLLKPFDPEQVYKETADNQKQP